MGDDPPSSAPLRRAGRWMPPGVRQLPREVRLRTSILSMMMLLTLSLAGSLILFSAATAKRESLAAAQAAMAAAADQVLSRLRLLLVPPMAVVDVATSIEALHHPPDASGHPAEAFLLDVLRRFPAFRSIVLGFDDGTLLQVYRLGPERVALRAAIAAPPDASHAVRQIAFDLSGQLQETWRFDGDGGRPLGMRASARPGIDPRLLPWFTAAQGSHGTISTSPAPFPTGEVGITVARAFVGQPSGVIGIDVTVEALGGFLREQLPAVDGLAILFRGTGAVVASSDPAGATKAAGARAGLLDALLTLGRERRLDRVAELDIGGVPWLARLSSLPLTLGPDAFLGIAVPARRFTEAWDAMLRRTVLISLAIAAVFIPLMLVASRSIARPLHALTGEVDRIRAFQLDGAVTVRSRVIEVNRLARSIATTKSVLRSFSLYVPKDLVRQLVEAGAEPGLGGERRDITVLFSDLVGFTSFTERTEPERVVQVLSAYFAALTRAIAAEGGTVDKFIGDSVMAFWNAPLAQDDHAAAACRAALAARDRCDRLSRAAAIGANTADEAAGAADAGAAEPAGAQGLAACFGLHCGEAIVGHVGSRERLSYTAIGSVVNLASRLEGANRHLGTAILVSAAVEERVRGRFLMRSAGSVQLRGIDRPIAVFELVAAVDPGPAA